MVDDLPGFDGESAMEEGGRKRDFGGTNDTFLGVEHVPCEPGFEGGWEIDKQVEAMALLVEWGIVSRVGHFRLQGCLEFESNIERIALPSRLGSGVNAIPTQSG